MATKPDRSSKPADKVLRRVFVSLNADAHHSDDQNAFKWGIVDRLVALGYLPEVFTPPPGRRFRGGLAVRRGWTFHDVEQVMQRCCGHVMIGMPRWRVGSDDTERVNLPTEYHHYEGAVSHMLKLPTLILADQSIAD